MEIRRRGSFIAYESEGEAELREGGEELVAVFGAESGGEEALVGSGEGVSAGVEAGELEVEGIGGKLGRAAGCALEHGGDGFGDAGGVVGVEGDDFAIELDAFGADGGLDGAKVGGGDAGELGEFEIDGAEFFEEGDEAVGMAAGDLEMGAAVVLPRGGDGAEEFLVADLAEGFDVGGGAASGDLGIGAALAEHEAEFEEEVGVRGGVRHEGGGTWMAGRARVVDWE